MAETKKITVTGARLFGIRSGLVALKERKVEFSVEMRTAIWYRAMQAAWDVYVEILKKIEADEAKARRSANIADLEDCAERRRKLEDQEFEIPAPKKKLTHADMPKDFKGEGGEANGLAAAGIMVALAPEFCDIPTEEPD